MFRIATPLVLLALQLGCGWDGTPNEDAGHAAWVLEAVPTLLGRAPKSTDEVRVLTQIAQTHGRERVAQELMEQPEFSRYWALVLMDKLDLDQWSGQHTMQSDCLYPDVSPNNPTFHGYISDHHLDMDDARAQGILSPILSTGADAHAPATDDVPFSHLIEASIRGDRLDVAMAAYAPVLLATHSTYASAFHGEEQQRREFTNRLTRRMFNRDLACIGCHNGEYSTTDDPLLATNGTDRTYPVAAFDWEGGLFDWQDHLGAHHSGSVGGTDVEGNIRNVFTSKLWEATPGGTSHRPFNLRESCVERKHSAGQFVAMQAEPSVPTSQRVHVAGLDHRGGHSLDVLDFAEALFTGAQQDPMGWAPSTPGETRCELGRFDGANCYIRPAPPNAFIWNNGFYTSHHGAACPAYTSPSGPDHCRWFGAPAGTNAFLYNNNWYVTPSTPAATPANVGACLGCHNDGAGNLDPGFAELPDWRIQQALVNPPAAMAFSQCVDDPTCAAGYVAGVRAIHPFQEPFQAPTSERSLATLTALQLVDHVVEEVSGARLTLSHGHPRNAAQAQQLYGLTETFMLEGWSLKALLTDIVLSGAFNRVSPDVSTLADPYILPQVFEPYQQQPSGSSAQTHASVGDMVHRHSVTRLVETLHHAIGWSSSWTPAWHASAYPSFTTLRELGRFESKERPGWDEAILPGMLTWDETVGDCTKPLVLSWDPEIGAGLSGPIVSGASITDWIDVLATSSTNANLGVRDTVRMLKERLIADPRLDPAEEAAIATALGVTDLSGQVNSVTNLNAGLRKVCGAIASSPQYVLGGVGTAADDLDAADLLSVGDALPDRPAWRGEPTNVADWCDHYGAAIFQGVCSYSTVEAEAHHELSF